MKTNKKAVLTHLDLGEDANSETLNEKIKGVNSNPKDEDEYTVRIDNAVKSTFTINHKNLLSVLQALSKINDTVKFSIKNKE